MQIREMMAREVEVIHHQVQGRVQGLGDLVGDWHAAARECQDQPVRPVCVWLQGIGQLTTGLGSIAIRQYHVCPLPSKAKPEM
jgi:hypothetical protein